MPVLKQTILTVAPLNDAVAVALVERAGRSVRTIASETAHGAEAMTPEAILAACSRLAASRSIDEIVLTLPAAWCSCREIGIPPRDWKGARDGVMESLEDLVPVPSDDALVGLLALHESDETCSRGVIVAARRSLVEPVLDAMRAAAPGARESVVSSSMAAIGLAAGAEGALHIVEPDSVASTSMTLRNGLPVAIDAPAQGEEAIDLSGDSAPGALAVAAVVAPLTASASFVPLIGRTRPPWARYVRPGALVAAAILMLAAAPVIWESRMANAVESLRDQRAAMQASFDEAQSYRAQAERSIALCTAFDEATTSWRSTLPALRDAVAALGDDGHLYRFQCDSRGVLLTGEAADPGSVLERLESSPGLTAARPTSPITPSPTDPSLRVFTFTAEVEGQ